MKFDFIELHRSEFRVSKMCQVLSVTRSAYYAWRKRPKNNREQKNERLLIQIRQIHNERRKNTYGSPRMTIELRKKGILCNKKCVARLMRQNGIVAQIKRRFKITTHSKHNLPVAKNLLNQTFKADHPDQIWASDITYIRTREGWLYLTCILDIYSRYIVGWSMSEYLTQDIVLNALRGAVLSRNPSPGLIFHSDRGVQYAASNVREFLKEHKITQSMSSKGNCYDNAIMETFFHTLKTELVYFENYKTRAEARQSIFDYIEIFYNRIRRHSSIGYCAPNEYLNHEKAA